MAHFAKLDDTNRVVAVLVVNNDVLDPANEEASGIAFLTEWSGGDNNWVQTSYNGKIRARYAGVGFTYDETLDAFIPPKCHKQATLNPDTANWDCTDTEHEVNHEAETM